MVYEFAYFGIEFWGILTRLKKRRPRNGLSYNTILVCARSARDFQVLFQNCSERVILDVSSPRSQRSFSLKGKFWMRQLSIFYTSWRTKCSRSMLTVWPDSIFVVPYIKLQTRFFEITLKWCLIRSVLRSFVALIRVQLRINALPTSNIWYAGSTYLLSWMIKTNI